MAPPRRTSQSSQGDAPDIARAIKAMVAAMAQQSVAMMQQHEASMQRQTASLEQQQAVMQQMEAARVAVEDAHRQHMEAQWRTYVLTKGSHDSPIFFRIYFIYIYIYIF